MKLKIFSASVLVMAAAMSLAACSGGQSAGTSSSGESLKMATGGTTGTYYSYGGAVAQALSENLEGIKIGVHSSGASKANILEIADKDADIAIVQNDVAYYAYNGTDLFDSEKVQSFSVLGGVYAEVCQIISKTDIQSIEDLKGKVVSVGDAGSGVEFNARQILEVYGLSFDDIKKQNLSFGDSAEALKDGKIDAFFCVAGAPTTAVVELATTNEIDLLSIDADKAAALKEKYPFYTDYTIPSGTYKGIDVDKASVAVKATFIVSNDLSEDTVYKITKALYADAKDKIVHDKAKELSPEYAVSGISIPFHPGAEKYYKEAGALK